MINLVYNLVIVKILNSLSVYLCNLQTNFPDRHINQWLDFCRNHGTDSQNASVKDCLDFLTSLYEPNKRYSVFSKPIFSLFIQVDNTVEFGKQPIVQKCMKGIHKLWPYLTKYIFLPGT